MPLLLNSLFIQMAVYPAARVAAHADVFRCSFTTEPSTRTSFGIVFSLTDWAVTIHFATSSREGRSYITSSIIFSMMERSPRAPVFRSMALCNFPQSSFKFKLHYQAGHFWYCFTNAFSVLSRCRRAHLHRKQIGYNGKTADEPGINPKWSKSSGCTWDRICLSSISFC